MARLLVACTVLLLLATGARAQTVRIDRLSHIHGLAVDPSDPERLYLATHEGLFLATPDGLAIRVGALEADLMGFTPDPADGARLVASGHPAGGGNLGVIASSDGGRTWRKLSDGAGGPVDFHALAISPLDPNLMFGVHQGLQASRDGGRTWQRVGPAPAGLLALAASAKDADTLYAATRGGLYRSRDGGRSWSLGYILKRPATMVHATPGGRLYAFIYGVGLVATDEPALAWRPLATRFGDRVVLQLAVDPKDPDRLHALADTGGITTSTDGGRTWTGYIGHHRASAEIIAAGAALYRANCAACHGPDGTGEPPEAITDPAVLRAPALDNSEHGWHHSDLDLIDTILEGSPVEGSRMGPWKDTLSRAEAESLVAYMKSLWNFRSHACQGAWHMKCRH